MRDARGIGKVSVCTPNAEYERSENHHEIREFRGPTDTQGAGRARPFVTLGIVAAGTAETQVAGNRLADRADSAVEHSLSGTFRAATSL